MTEQALPQVLRVHGNKARVARCLNISTAAVSQWDRVPSKHVAKVAEVLDVTPHEVRPDLFQPAGVP